MPKIIGAMLVHFDPESFLDNLYGGLYPALASLKEATSGLVILDDCSNSSLLTDRCKLFKPLRFESLPEPTFMKNEPKARARLWEMAAEEAGMGNWILCLDSDEVIARRDQGRFNHRLRQLDEKLPEWDRQNTEESDEPISYAAFQLFDMWDSCHYREDQWWNAHTRNWPLMVRYLGQPNVWPDQPVHCGRFPQGAIGKNGIGLSARIQHWGWAAPERRQRKFERYKLHDPDCKYGIKEQYESILDPHPNLVRWRD